VSPGFPAAFGEPPSYVPVLPDPAGRPVSGVPVPRGAAGVPALDEAATKPDEQLPSRRPAVANGSGRHGPLAKGPGANGHVLAGPAGLSALATPGPVAGTEQADAVPAAPPAEGDGHEGGGRRAREDDTPNAPAGRRAASLEDEAGRRAASLEDENAHRTGRRAALDEDGPHTPGRRSATLDDDGPLTLGRRSATLDDEAAHQAAHEAAHQAAHEAAHQAAHQGGRRSATLDDDAQLQAARRAATLDDDGPFPTGRRAPTLDEDGPHAAGHRSAGLEDDLRAPLPRRSASLEDAEPVRRGRRAAPEPEEAGDEHPLRPGDVAAGHIAFWDDDATRHFRAAWHEVKAEFVDDPVRALTRAHDLLTDAVNELTEALLAERDELDPLRGTDTPDTESMRMAMRGYREFLDRILAL
jgi:hypothetical protein